MNGHDNRCDVEKNHNKNGQKRKREERKKEDPILFGPTSEENSVHDVKV